MAKDSILYEPYASRYFTGNAEEIEKAEERLKAETKKELENVSKRGEITIPRGLSDEEVLERYHDKEINEQIDKQLRCEYYEVLWKKLYEALGIQGPSHIECDENGQIICAYDWGSSEGYRFY